MKTMVSSQQDMLDLFQHHVDAELAGDLETTMATMSDHPHLINVPVMMGGVGREGVRAFYKDHLIGKFFPPDVKMTVISRTIDDVQIVEEVVATFTHTIAMDWMLPQVLPTHKKVEVALVVIVKFENNKIVHEHIYWDQASVLTQIGLLQADTLPVCGVEGARRILKTIEDQSVTEA